VPWLHKFFVHGNGIALVAARTSSDWFHEVVVPAAPLFCFPNEPGTGVVLLGMGDVACATLRRSGLGVCMVIDSEDF
jgi:hypothetical protein